MCIFIRRSFSMMLSCPHFYFSYVFILGYFLIAASYYYYSSVWLAAHWNHNVLVSKDNRSSPNSSLHLPLLRKNVSYPWDGDLTCQHFSVQFAANKSRPAWALTSFPGSGVTWTRQMVEGLTGIFTGTVYGPGEPGIIDGSYYGNNAEEDCGCTILIKDHGYPEFYPYVGNEGPYQGRAILLLRNPFDALFSFAHYLWSGNNQKGTASYDLFSGYEWEKHIKHVTFEWAEHADRWIKNIKNGTAIFYERLVEDTENELKRLLRAINFIDPHNPPVDPERMRCTLLHKNRLDRKRKHKPIVLLTKENHSKMMSSIQKVQESLQKKGWPLLPLHLYHIPPHIDS